MIPSCIWIQHVTTPKTPPTVIHCYWVSRMVQPRPKILTCVTVTQCNTVPWDKSLAPKKTTNTAQTLCLTMSTCEVYWEQLKGSTVIPKTTCIYVDAPNPSFCVGYTCETVPPKDYPKLKLTGKDWPKDPRPIFGIVTSPKPKDWSPKISKNPPKKTTAKPTPKATPDNMVDGLIFEIAGDDQEESNSAEFETESPGPDPRTPITEETPTDTTDTTDTADTDPTEGGVDPPDSNTETPAPETPAPETPAPETPAPIIVPEVTPGGVDTIEREPIPEEPQRRDIRNNGKGKGRRQPQNGRPSGGKGLPIQEIRETVGNPDQEDGEDEDGNLVEGAEEEVRPAARRPRDPRIPQSQRDEDDDIPVTRRNTRRRRTQGKGKRN